MAIEFNCPYCTSKIRVPDDASGKKGTCPRCETPIMVPVIEMQPSAPVPTESPAAPAAVEAPPAPAVEVPPPPPVEAPPPAAVAPQPIEQTLDFAEMDPHGEPVFPGPPTASAGDFPAFETATAPPSEPVPSYAQAIKRRRKRKKGMGVVVPVVFGVGLVAVVIFLWLQSQPSLNGELTAEVLENYQSATGGIGKSDVEDLPKEVIDYVLEDLQQNPARLTSSLMETEFNGVQTGIEVQVYEGKETTFFRVAPRENKDFNDWVTKNASALGKPRSKEFKSAVKRFFVEYDETEGEVPDLAGYRDSMGLTATVSRVGYNMVAVVGGKAHRCVYEDAQQRLYFLLPRKTRQFELKGRKLDSGEVIFPGHYDVKVE